MWKLKARSARMVGIALCSVSVLGAIGGVALASPYGSAASPVKVYDGGSSVGASYGSYASKVSVGNGAYGSTGQGNLRDYRPGSSTIYVKLTAIDSMPSGPVYRSVKGEESNDSRWIACPKFSVNHGGYTFKVHLNVCENLRFAPDPCSTTIRVLGS